MWNYWLDSDRKKNNSKDIVERILNPSSPVPRSPLPSPDGFSACKKTQAQRATSQGRHLLWGPSSRPPAMGLAGCEWTRQKCFLGSLWRRDARKLLTAPETHQQHLGGCDPEIGHLSFCTFYPSDTSILVMHTLWFQTLSLLQLQLCFHHSPHKPFHMLLLF